MKLTNPTDDQLNEAFAVHVAGAEEVGDGVMQMPGGLFWDELPDWTSSFDAVLPWLEKNHCDCVITYSQTCCLWTVRLQQRFTGTKEFVAESEEGVSRAAVIALLRAHGVEVEFTAQETCSPAPSSGE